MNFVTYCRVSTDKQGIKGLGMDAQADLIARHVRSTNGKVLHAYVEVESGKNNARPQLAMALVHCKSTGATLLIAKLDRLARNVAFISSLMESGVEFIAADMPTANRLTIHILAAVAEHEAKMISDRTKAALAMSTKKLGGYRPRATITPAKRAASLQQRQDRATLRASSIAPMIQLIKTTGTTSLRGIAYRLNESGVKTARGGDWSAVQVSRIMGATK
jgi:DNA invertase Pin-like site-specific DNA recombinase